MKNILAKPINIFPLLLLLLSFIIVPIACNDDDDDANPDASYRQVNLVSNVSEYGASHIDTNLVNAWGMAVGSTGAFWISSTEKEKTTIYDRDGNTLLPAIEVEGEPTGVVFNSSSDFVIPSTALVSKFIYVGEDGNVVAWSAGSSTTEVADNSSEGAVYKGVTIAQDEGSNFLYIANFSEGEIEVLDKNFNYVEKGFEDATIPTGYAPFNIQNIDGKLYVTYALQSSDKYDDVAGAGHGYINVFNTDGTFVKRFASGGTLNSPWGITKAPSGFGQGDGNILVGNFGDGRINIYNSDGDYKGQLKDGDNPLTIEGLWALVFPKNGIPTGDQNTLFFTAGPDDEEQGLFGYIHLR